MTDKQINLAIGAITHAELVMDFPDTVLDALNSVIAFLATMNEQPERKKGKWIEFDSDEDRYDIIKCSHCKHIFTVDSYHWSDIGFVKDDFNFCPNCGADMREGEQSDD